MDYVGVKFFEPRQARTANCASSACSPPPPITQSAERIPLIRAKVAAIMRARGLRSGEPFRQGAAQRAGELSARRAVPGRTTSLYHSAMAILQLEERPRVRALARRDRFDRFVSVLVFVPRDRYTSDLRERIGDALAAALRRPGLGLLSRFLRDAPDARPVHHRTQSGDGAGPDSGRARSAIRDIVRTWDDDLAASVERRASAERQPNSFAHYAGALSARTIARASPRRMPLARHRDARPARCRTTSRSHFFRRAGHAGTRVRDELHHLGDPMPLSRRVPLLENLGFSVVNERTYQIAPERRHAALSCTT